MDSSVGYHDLPLASGLRIPLGLLLSGALIADYVNWESVRHGRRTIAASVAVRILALPALIMTSTRFAPLDVALKSVLVIQAAMPAAIFPSWSPKRTMETCRRHFVWFSALLPLA